MDGWYMDGWYIDHEPPDNNCEPDYADTQPFHRLSTGSLCFLRLPNFTIRDRSQRAWR